MWSPNNTPSLLATDVLDAQKISLDFSLLPPSAPKLTHKTDTPLISHALAKAELDKTLTEINEVNWFIKISNPTLYFFTKESELRKNVITTHLKSTVEKSNEAQLSIDQAQAKLLTLKTDHTIIKEQLGTFHQTREEAPSKVVLLQEKINQNLGEIKAVEPLLGSAFGKIYYSMLAAQAIDPSLIKQAFDPKQQPIEYLILNKDKHINNVEIQVKATQLIQDNSEAYNQLKHTLLEKLSDYHAIQKIHEDFKNSLPSDLTKLTPQQMSDAASLGEALRQSISEYDGVKKQMSDQLEQAKAYLKYHDTWSKLTPEEIHAANLISSKKQENTETNKSIDNLMAETSSHKEALLTEKLLLIETEMDAQEKIVFDNQLLLKTQQDFSDFFQQEAQKLEAPVKNIEADYPGEVQVDILPTPPTSIVSIKPGHLPDISHFDI